MTTTKKTLTALGGALVLFTLTACGSGGQAIEPVLNGDGSVSVDVETTGSIEPSSQSGATIEEAYLTFWSAVAGQQWETAAAYAHPEWLAEIGEEYGYADDAPGAIKAALYSQSYDEVWTDSEYASGWEPKNAFTTANYPLGYLPDLVDLPEAERDAVLTEVYAKKVETFGPDSLPSFCNDFSESKERSDPRKYYNCGTVLDSDADEVLVNVHDIREIRAVNGWVKGTNIARSVDGAGWQFNGPVRE